ncbi:MAG TPA: hypothetical protein H9743_00485 [Candidatus Mediterraneibacter vanvlietii]|nr:hypothetical protein [Candidatus Mediterraneibacter vanvlietii]
MNEYQRMLMYLKILQSNLVILHHNIVGPGWFEAHGVIDGYQIDLGGMVDDLIERGIALGYREPTIAESVLAFQTDVLPADKRERDESYRIIMEVFRSAAGLMQAAEPIVPADVTNKLQEIEYWLNKEANYKLAGALGKGEPDYDD